MATFPLVIAPKLTSRKFILLFTAIVAAYLCLFVYYLHATEIRQPFSDMMIYISTYLDYRRTGDLWLYLWSPHTQHRLVWTRLLTALDIGAFNGVAYPFTVAATASLVLASALLRAEVQRTGFSRDLKYVGGWLIVMLVLTTANVVDCSIPIEGIYPHTLVFAVLAIVLFEGNGGNFAVPRRIAAIAAAVGAALGSAVGLVIWPILLWQAWSTKAGWPWLMAVVGVGGIFSGLYVHGMPVPTSALSAIQGNAQFFDPAHVLKCGDYLLTYLGLPWTRAPSMGVAGRLVGAVFLVTGAAIILRHGFLRPSRDRLERIAVGLIMFSLATAVLAAVGRVDELAEVKVPVRYSVYLAPLHIGILCHAMPWLDRQWRKLENRATYQAVMIAVAVLLLVQQLAAGQSATVVSQNIIATINRFKAGERDPKMIGTVFIDTVSTQHIFDLMARARIYVDRSQAANQTISVAAARLPPFVRVRR